MINIHSHTWDQHLHFSAESVREADISRGRPLDLSVPLDEFMADQILCEATVVFGLKARLTGIWVPDEYVAQFVSARPDKLIGFASCDPTQPDYMDELHYAAEELGMRGLKMAPMYAGFDPRDRRCDPIYAYCQSHGLPILFHAGTTFLHRAPLEVTRPWLFDDVAIRYPELRMVLAHVGHPFCDECLAVIRKHPHVYADIAAVYYRPWQFYNTMVLANEYHVMHKLLFGTDYPFAKTQESIDGIRNVNHVAEGTHMPRVPQEAIESILDRDSLALLGLAKPE